MDTPRETIVLGSDHAGFRLKDHLKSYLYELGYPVIDEGTFDEQSVDYPDFAEKVALTVVSNPGSLGILVCATGVGISIAANKIRGIRAALVGDVGTASLCREHNDANILALAGKNYDSELVERIVVAWLSARFQGGRHARRIDKIRRLEEKYPGREP